MSLVIVLIAVTLVYKTIRYYLKTEKYIEGLESLVVNISNHYGDFSIIDNLEGFGMDIGKYLAVVTKFGKDNAPILTTVVGASGVVATAVVAARVGYNVGHDVAVSEEITQNRHIKVKQPKEIVHEHWKRFLPVVGVATITVGTIVLGHKVNASRATTLSAAYALSERTFGEYQRRVIEKLGADEEKVIRNEVRESEKAREEHKQVVVMDGRRVLCQDLYTGRYFESDMQSIRRAVNDVNHIAYSQGYCSLTEFYDSLGIEKTQVSDRLGWNNDKVCAVVFGSALDPDDKPVLTLQFAFNPFPDFDRFN